MIPAKEKEIEREGGEGRGAVRPHALELKLCPLEIMKYLLLPVRYLRLPDLYTHL